jgi:hypothetical protein
VAITQAMCTSFKLELLSGVHDFSTDTFKIALYDSGAALGASTQEYTTSNEVVASGYTAGGATLTVVPPASSGTTAYVDFDDVTWTASLTARGALIYNTSKSNKAVAVLNFGADKISITEFTIIMPAADANNALVRIA